MTRDERRMTRTTTIGCISIFLFLLYTTAASKYPFTSIDIFVNYSFMVFRKVKIIKIMIKCTLSRNGKVVAR